jgi:AcrR family transcriptional regulator
MTTREKILVESMKLFSVNGFDAVSIRTIAKEVGVGDSALYKHFASKQAILEAIVKESEMKFLNKYKEVGIQNITYENFEEKCMSMFLFQTQDEWITMFRRLLVIEQFKNQNMAQIYKQLFIDMPIKGQSQIFQAAIEKGMLKDRNAEVMAMELYAPFFLYHTVNEDNERLHNLLRKHLQNFKELYLREG